jgi:hypothetical protein
MDRFIGGHEFVEDGDLRLCLEDGVAYQWDRSSLIAYDESYFNKCAGYEGGEIALKINAGRVAMVDRHIPRRAVLDIGIGSGEFIKNRELTWGTDVNPAALRWLRENRLIADELHSFAGYTMWDVIEHVPTPEDYLRHIAPGAYLFVSIPVFNSLWQIRESKHYRPGEHLYYWTAPGFVGWLKRHGFSLLESSDFETQAGRESIMSFAFVRV